MLPPLRNGDQVVIVPVDISTLQPGDVAAYVDAGGRITADLVVRVQKEAIIIKGHNGQQGDLATRVRRVLGIVEA